MTLFAGKTVVLGVTGSIAAYKACDLASRLVEQGASVYAASTASAGEFLGAQSLQAITGHRVITGMFEPAVEAEIEHIALARKADLYLIAPATANILAKAAHGIADDWISTTLLATRAPVLFAPAMNMHMYAHPATQANIRLLAERGAFFVGPDEGHLACGDVGPGRLAATEAILEAASIALAPRKDLNGRHVLITSGANHEPIDPVRYLGNRSSGRMGRALALEALRRGARVTVVTGPAETSLPRNAEVIRVETAREMLNAVDVVDAADTYIFAAAVADYHVANVADEKHKRGDEELRLELAPNPDIAAHIGLQKRPGQITVGFAAETTGHLDNARRKLTAKQLDLIVANDVSRDGGAIGSDSARAWILAPDTEPESFERIEKDALAAKIFDRVAALLAHVAVGR